MRALIVMGLLMLGLALPAAADEIYRVVAPDGSVHFTDKPPSKTAKPLVLGPVSGPIPSGKQSKSPAFYSPELLRQAARFAVRVESPTPGQVQGNEQAVIAAASVMPGLVKGFSLVYLVDGKAVTPKPVDELSLPLPGLAAGDHELVIVLLNSKGVEIARSEAARFTLRAAPKTARAAP